MAIKGEIVRCPIDYNEDFHRDFAIGKIISVNEDEKKVRIEFFDTNNVVEYYDKPEIKEISLSQVNKTKLNNNAKVLYNNEVMVVKACKYNKVDKLYYYYIQSNNGYIHYVSEIDIYCGFNDGYINPIIQLRNMEFQNPQWFFGRNIVSKAMNNINTSLYGFKYLIGCKIVLKPHQLRTVMRCVKNKHCRVMLADEVGMGKTIEALSILKVFMNDYKNKRVSIIVPATLKEQWIIELAFKFKIFEGSNTNNIYITIKSFNEINGDELNSDFVIIDEVHRVLKDFTLFNKILNISKNVENIVMLSATPLQKRKDEYKRLLTLIQPTKYENMSNDMFNKILEKQSSIVKRIFNLRDELASYLEELENANATFNDDLEEMFEEIIDEFKSLNNILNDKYINEKLNKISFESSDLGVKKIKNLISYICENYQLEKSIIRNRRSKGFEEEYNKRELIDCSYDIENSTNQTEYKMYLSLSDWISTLNIDFDNYNKYIIPLIHSFFSSAKAFKTKIFELKNKLEIPNELFEQTKIYSNSEDDKVKNLCELLDDIQENQCKLVKIIDFLDQECYDAKTLIFTDYNETFELYKKVIVDYFGEEYCSFFDKNMGRDELETNVYKFQTNKNCKILLSDKSGGEGRNFQNADYLINIDIPWDANEIEQRIGRLDRIGRDVNKSVKSVVFYAKNSLEEDLFNIWNKGLGIFEKSQSGLEIIMQDITNNIIENLRRDFKFGLSLAIDEILKLVEIQIGELKKERLFDISAYEYKNLNLTIERTLAVFNKNEKSIFADAMLGWASLTGFNAFRDSENIVTFTQNSISYNSLKKTFFIPPDMRLIINDKMNQMRNRIRNLSGENNKQVDTSYIRGTFDRNVALQNDYLNFFAPGDEIFDSIVNNSLNSYRGTCSAIKVYAGFNWNGFVFTWKIELDESLIYDSKLNPHLIDEYIGFLPREFITNVYGLMLSDDLNDKALKHYNKLCNDKSMQARAIHLGRRKGNEFSTFRKKFHTNDWCEIVKVAFDDAHKHAIDSIKKKYNVALKIISEELNDSLNANIYMHKYFSSNYEHDNLENENKIVFEIMKKIKVKLDSVCYLELYDGK